MEFLKAAKRRSFWSEAAYIGLNIALALALLLVIVTTKSLPFAIILVLLSKWRVFAVRPRYWMAHLQSNLVDFIVSLSFVVLLYAADGMFVVQALFTMVYIAWLLFLRPRSNRMSMIVQSGIAILGGVMALSIVSPDWPSFFVILGFWVIGYGTARHVLTAYSEGRYLSLLSLLWGLIMAELGWMTYHWTIAYNLPMSGNVMLPQVAIVALLLGFLAERAYRSYHYHQKIRSSDIMMPLLFVCSVLALLVVLFNATPNSLL